jgi:hypothetical protein
VRQTKFALVEFLLTAARQGKRVAGYGAPGKSATLLNYCGIGKDLIEYTVDRSPYKQGRFLPGTHIPIYHPDRIRETKPDYVVILPWNLKDESWNSCSSSVNGAAASSYRFRQSPHIERESMEVSHESRAVLRR